jgi:hypothetical protein
MSRARTLAGAIGSDGALNVADVAGLAAVASSGSASDLLTGTLPNGRLATGAAVANLGYTPLNKAGDTMTGDLNLNSSSILKINSGNFAYNMAYTYSDAGTTSSANTRVQVDKWTYQYVFDDYIGTGGTTSTYTFFHIPISYNWVAAYELEVMQGGWSYGQASSYARWIIQVVTSSVTVTNLESVGGGNYTCSAKNYNPNAGSNMYIRIAVNANQGSNSIFLRLHATTPIDAYSGFYHGRTSSNPTA